MGLHVIKWDRDHIFICNCHFLLINVFVAGARLLVLRAASREAGRRRPRLPSEHQVRASLTTVAKNASEIIHLPPKTP